MNTECNLLFVYGTLQSNFTNEYALFLRNNAELLAPAFSYGYLYKISWYPGFVYDENTTSKVYGELYKFKNKLLLSYLDVYEDINSGEYSRKQIKVTYNNLTVISWAYIFNKNNNNVSLISDGIFKD